MGAILVPFNGIEKSSLLINSSAEEFYCGFCDPDFSELFGPHAQLNRCSVFGPSANAMTFAETLEASEYLHVKGKDLFVTLNATEYTDAELSYLADLLPQLARHHVRGIIASHPALIPLIAEADLIPVVSTIAGVYNSNIANFFVERGAGRIVLPRDLTVPEIDELICAFPDVQFEIFMMRNGCVFSDSHCLGLHSNEHGSLCSEMRKAPFVTLGTEASVDAAVSFEHYRRFHEAACGLCALYHFESRGVAAHKIVGRMDEQERVFVDTMLTASARELARKCRSEEEYLDKIGLHPYADQLCIHGLNCYYPELKSEAVRKLVPSQCVTLAQRRKVLGDAELLRMWQ